jgi:2-oxoglutarate ferredoxin oxidoreductase subunit beta
VINAAWENGIKPHQIAKMSGIGCSSKTPAYFLGKAHGFNTVHGRMPSVSTGARITNTDLKVLGVSGDGDSASIGIGQFIHAIRRNVNMVYIIENNGVYGLTKGLVNEIQPIDMCKLAVNLGATFVARSFSGAKKQLTSLLKAALSHDGIAIIDVISPCVAFANNDESFRSYNYVKKNETELHVYDYIPHFSPVEQVDIPAGEYEEIEMHDGSILRLETIGKGHDSSNPVAALTAIHEAEIVSKHVTGLLYYDPGRPSLSQSLNLSDTPLCQLSEEDMRPDESSLDEILAHLRG